MIITILDRLIRKKKQMSAPAGREGRIIMKNSFMNLVNEISRRFKTGFQPLETFSGVFPMIGNFFARFSNDWKLLAGILNREWTRMDANGSKMGHKPASSRTAGLRRSRMHERHGKGGMLIPGTADRLIGRFFAREFFSLRSLWFIPSGSLNYRTDFFRTGDVL